MEQPKKYLDNEEYCQCNICPHCGKRRLIHNNSQRIYWRKM
jgi:hypothetical protein